MNHCVLTVACFSCRLHCQLSFGHLSGVVCVQRSASLPGVVVRAGQQGHDPAVFVPLLHPAVLLLWQHCGGPHLGALPSHLQLQGTLASLACLHVLVHDLNLHAL